MSEQAKEVDCEQIELRRMRSQDEEETNVFVHIV